MILSSYDVTMEKKLYIIGNGFDKHHGLKTSYWDFRIWLENHNCVGLIKDMGTMFPKVVGNNFLLWKDFEMALGYYDASDIHDVFFQGKDDQWWNEKVQNRVVDYIKPILINVREMLKDWINDIDLDGIKTYVKNIENDVESMFLTFNYTLLLERVYYIQRENICHIHGSIEEDKCITGHNVYNAELQYYNDNVNKEKSVNNIIALMNTYRKPVNDIIKQHSVFFESLKDINQVVVYGHSLSSIDMPYFQEIVNHIGEYKVWRISSHGYDDTDRIKKVFNTYSFRGIECEIFDF